MYFHAPCGVVLYSVMLCLYIVECNCNFHEHKKMQIRREIKTIRKNNIYLPPVNFSVWIRCNFSKDSLDVLSLNIIAKKCPYKF